MKLNNQIEIPLNKTKLTFMLAGSIAFVVLGFWLVIKLPESNIAVLGNPVTAFITGVASILFFGMCAVMVARKITKNAQGLIVTNEGITDNSGGISAGLILWKDIKDIKQTTVGNQAFILVVVKNPEDYIARQKGFIGRKVMALNYKSYDTPITISSNGLKCDFNELYLT